MAFPENRIEFYIRNDKLIINEDNPEVDIISWMGEAGFHAMEAKGSILGYVYPEGVQIYLGSRCGVIADFPKNFPAMLVKLLRCWEANYPESTEAHVYNGIYCGNQEDVWPPIEDMTSMCAHLVKSFAGVSDLYIKLGLTTAPGDVEIEVQE